MDIFVCFVNLYLCVCVCVCVSETLKVLWFGVKLSWAEETHDPRPLQLPKVTNHTPKRHRSFSSSFVGSSLGWVTKIWWFFFLFFLFGFERWGLGMDICGFVGFFFFFWILSENWSNMVFLLEYEWLWICLYALWIYICVCVCVWDIEGFMIWCKVVLSWS